MQLSTSRVVGFLTPVFAAGAAIGTPFLVKLGFHVDSSQVTALAVTGATSVTAVSLKWLHGLSLWEREKADADRAWGDVDHFLHISPEALEEIKAAVKAAAPNVDQIAAQAADSARAKLVAVLTPTPPEAVPAAPADPVPAA